MKVCILVNGEKFQTPAVTLTLIGFIKEFSTAKIYSNFSILGHLFCLHTPQW